MCDQDYIHNHKKLLNPLDHEAHNLMMGNCLVHMNHQLVYDVFTVPDHGLGTNDIARSNRQNWRSAQKLTFPTVRQCLPRLIDGEGPNQVPNPTLLGMETYLQIVWYYVETFCSSVASLQQQMYSMLPL